MMKRVIAVVLAVTVAADAQRPAPNRRNRPIPALTQAGTNTTTSPTEFVGRPTNMPTLSPMTPFPTEGTSEPTIGDSEILTQIITNKPSFSMPMTVVVDCFSGKSGKTKGGKKNYYSGGAGRNYGYAGEYGGAWGRRCGKSGKTKGGKVSGGNNYGYGGSSWVGKSGKSKGGKSKGSSWGKSGKGYGAYNAGHYSGGNNYGGYWGGSSRGKAKGGKSGGGAGGITWGAGGSKGGKSGGSGHYGYPSSWGYYDGKGYYYRRDLTSENAFDER